MDFSVREQKKKKMLLMNSWSILKEHSTVVKEHNSSVSSSWPPLLPSRGQDVCQSVENEPCCPSATCRLSLHCGSASNQSTDTVHFHRFTSFHLHTVYSIFEACRKLTSPLGLTETSECLCTVIPTVVHLCCTRAWWEPGEAD